MRYIRQKPYASTFFKTNGGIATQMGAVPRYKFMYYANFVASEAALDLYPEYAKLGNWEEGISFKIHAIDKPNIDLTVSELNQYNRKRYAYTKINYHPCNIKLYDTVDDTSLELWRRYFEYYFGDSRQKGASGTGAQTIYNEMTVNPTFTYDSGWGLSPKRERYNFFDRIEVYALFGGRYTQINYINPKITRSDFMQYESSSSDMAELNLTIVYEAIEFLPSKVITAEDATKFGFDFEPALEVPGVPTTRGLGSPRRDLLGILGDLQQGFAGLLGSDLVRGISNTFQVANTTLNIFSKSPFMSLLGTNAGRTLGQWNQSIYNANTGLTLITNPSQPSNFLGKGYSYTQQAVGVLGQFGSFNFGR